MVYTPTEVAPGTRATAPAFIVLHAARSACLRPPPRTPFDHCPEHRRVEPEQAGSGVDPQLLRFLQQQSGDQHLYVGESPLRWDLCDRTRMRRGIEIELKGGNPRASRLRLD